MLKDVTKNMRKKVKEYALVSAENLDGIRYTEFIQSLNLLPPNNNSKLNDKLVLKLAKLMEFCETSIRNFSSSQRRNTTNNHMVL